MKVRMTIEVDLVKGMELYDDEERVWAENEVFVGDGNFILHSNEVGDKVGIVKNVTDLIWIDEETTVPTNKDYHQHRDYRIEINLIEKNK